MISTVGVLLLGTYVLSIVWRASCEEQKVFGRSDLIPLTLKPQNYNEPPTPESFGTQTYACKLRGKTTAVCKQYINSFQHAYGSALASRELGTEAADYLFRANEYCEAIWCRNSGSSNFYWDTKKDLVNNAAGREIGQRSKQKYLMERLQISLSKRKSSGPLTQGRLCVTVPSQKFSDCLR